MRCKRFFSILLILLLINSIAAFAEQKRHMDTIILVDISGSMRASDRTRISIEAIKMYIDMMETSGSRIGIMTFSDEINELIPMTTINNIEDKENLKRIIDNITYDGYTDIGLAVKTGVEELIRVTNDLNDPVLVLFTDGRIEIDENNTAGRTPDQSLLDVITSIESIKDTLPIYTIGLNYNNDVDSDLLQTISDTTNGRSYITSTADNLPQIFNEIFADYIRSTLIEAGTYITDGENFVNVTINIPNPVVAEANIILLSQEQIIDAQLIDANGNMRSFDDEDIQFTYSNKYSMIKVINPIEGDWTLRVKGIEGDSVKVNLIYNYNLDLKMLYDENEPFEEGIRLTGKLFTGDRVLDDEVLYEELIGYIVIEKADGFKQEIEMENLGSFLYGEISPEIVNSFDQDVKIYLRAENKDYNRVSQVLEINKENILEIEEIPVVSQPADTRVNKLLIGAIVSASIAVILSVVIFKLRKKPNIVFKGSIQVKIFNKKEIQVVTENLDLSTYVGRITLDEIMTIGARIKFVRNIEAYGEYLQKIYISQNNDNVNCSILFENDSEAIVKNDEDVIVTVKRFNLTEDKKIVIARNESDVERIELTYKAY